MIHSIADRCHETLCLRALLSGNIVRPGSKSECITILIGIIMSVHLNVIVRFPPNSWMRIINLNTH